MSNNQDLLEQNTIAIIGMAGKFPGAKSIDEFWYNLENKVDVRKEYPDEELIAEGISLELLRDPNYIKCGYQLDDLEWFDAEFFNISPKEAAIIDPQQRLFLECVWEGLEMSGYDPASYEGRIGLYAGSKMNSYLLNNIYPFQSKSSANNTFDSFELLLGNDKDYLTSRVSYKLNLKGPSIVVQTACSTSLVAVHLASEALLNGDCDMAIAGGVSVRVPVKHGYYYQESAILSPDGYCKPFSDQANGTVEGNGLGIVVLKRFEDAINDADSILAVIRSSAVNNDGGVKVGFTAPGSEGQINVISEALEIAGIEPDSISLVEAHGTGTPLGDPIEAAALKEVYDIEAEKAGSCALGSVKSNIGHLDTAAGIASLIKVTLSLKKRVLVPSLHFRELNTKIDFSNSRFYVNTETKPWESGGQPGRAGVSSFGIGGTNAHVILEEAPIRKSDISSSSYHLLILSTKSESALLQASENLLSYLKKTPDVNMADVAFTLQRGRRHFEYRRTVVCQHRDEAIEKLADIATNKIVNSVGALTIAQVDIQDSFLQNFYELYAQNECFHGLIDICAQTIVEVCPINLVNLIKQAEPINNLVYASFVQFSLQYALAKWFVNLGLYPNQLVGEATTGLVCGCLAEVFSLKEAYCILASCLGEKQPSGWEKKISFRCPQIPIYLGEPSHQVTDDEAVSLEYWQAIWTSKKCFGFTAATFAQENPGVLIELGEGEYCRRICSQDPSANWPKIFDIGPQDKISVSLMKHVLNLLGQLWVHGFKINWEGVYGSEQRLRLHLPTYPFERKRYWIDAPKVENKLANPPTGKSKYEKSGEKYKQTSYLVPSWRQMPQPKTNGRDACISKNSRYMIIQDSYGYGYKFANKLKEYGCEIVEVIGSSSYQQLTEMEFLLDLQESNHYDQLFSTLDRTGKLPKYILHMSSLGFLSNENTTSSAQEQFWGLLALLQALGRRSSIQGIKLSVITDCTQDVSGADELIPNKSILEGFIKVVPHEYPQIDIGLIDIRIKEIVGRRGEQLISSIIDDSVNQRSSNIIAYRQYKRWTKETVPIELANSQNPVQLKKNGVYLITGGLGGLGLELADFLTKSVPCKLALLGRSGLPPRQDWSNILESIDGHLPGSTTLGSEKYFNINQSIEPLSIIECELHDKFKIKGINTYSELPELLHQLCSGYILIFMSSHGLSIENLSQYTNEELYMKLGTSQRYKKMLDFFLHCLMQDGLIEEKDGMTNFTHKVNSQEPPHVIEDRICSKFPRFKGMIDLLAHCANQYSAVFSGDVDPIEVLYPEGKTTLFEDAFERTVEYNFHRIYSYLLRDFIENIIEAHASRTLRILEIGGGEGHLTKVLVPMLQKYSVEYYFTDISKSFVISAEHQIKQEGYKFVSCGKFDITLDPLSQGFDLNDFDIIVGLDVVHATPDLEKTLSNLKRLLVPNGLICLIETTSAIRWLTMVMGLTDGWWNFEDYHLRPNSALLDKEKWQEVLEKAKYVNVEIFPRTEQLNSVVDCCLIIAQQEFNVSAEDYPYWEGKNNRKSKDSIKEKIRKVIELENSGSEVIIVNADVANERQMNLAFSEIKQRLGSIDGIIHAAGVPDGKLIQQRTKEDIKRIFRAKIDGAHVLADLVKGKELDFWANCSSIISFYGGVGQLAHCAANQFLDMYSTELMRNTQPNTYVINWDAWDEVGQAAESKALFKEMSEENVFSGGNIKRTLIDKRIFSDGVLDIFETYLSVRENWFLAEHRIYDKVVMPGAVFLEMALEAGRIRCGDTAVEMSNILFVTPLFFEEFSHKRVRTLLKKNESNFEFSIVSFSDEENKWQLNAKGIIRISPVKESIVFDLNDLRKRCQGEELKERFTEYGERWNCLKYASVDKLIAFAELELEDRFSDELGEFYLHPAVFDVASSFLSTRHKNISAYVPFSFKRVHFFDSLPKKVYSFARSRGEKSSLAEALEFSVTILDSRGRRIVDIDGLTMRRVDLENKQNKQNKQTVFEGQDVLEKIDGYRFANNNCLSPLQGREAFKQILNSGLNQVIVTKSVHEAYPNKLVYDKSISITEDIKEISVDMINRLRKPRPELSSEYIAARDEIDSKLAEIWCETLGLEKAGIDDNFFELGGDSLLSIQVCTLIYRDFEEEIPNAILFEFPSIRALANYIKELKSEVPENLVLENKYSENSSRPKMGPYFTQIIDTGSTETISKDENVKDSIEKLVRNIQSNLKN